MSLPVGPSPSAPRDTGATTAAPATGALWVPIPRRALPGLARRFGLLCIGALLMSIANGLVQTSGGAPRFGISAAYTYGISLSTWLLIDVGRHVLRRPLGAEAPGYWPKNRLKAGLLVLFGIAFGYIGGTWLGDQASGRSTLELLWLNPARFYGVLGGSLFISLIWLGFFYQRGRHEALARQAQQARLDLLVSQLEPHMLFNTLANLRVLIARDPAQAQAMLDRLVGFLRTTLAASRSTTHPLAAEFARVADYLALMGMRMGPRLQVQLNLPEALAAQEVPTLLLQPLVENAMAHGLEPSVRGGRIEVGAALRDGAGRAGPQIVLTVRDTGIGLDAARPEGGTGAAPGNGTRAGTGGYGLTHVRERLQTLHGSAATLTLAPATDAEGGTIATIVLPARRTESP
jgi:signal transduction histidine kinase